MREKGRRRESTGESKNERKREKEESSEDVREREQEMRGLNRFEAKERRSENKRIECVKKKK